MGVEAFDQDPRWAADKREFVADSRDDAADAREADADRREATADAREAMADRRDAVADAREAELAEWEGWLRARAEELRTTFRVPMGAAQRRADRDSRPQAAEERIKAMDARHAAARERGEATSERNEASRRRLAEDRPTLLAAVFAEIAAHLYQASTYEEVLGRIAEAAVATITGGKLASLTVAEGDAYRTTASTGEAATAVDQAQYDAHEGPSLDALQLPLVDAPAFPDQRWPRLGARPTEHGVQSSVSYRLQTVSRDGRRPASQSLNVYGATPAAFDADAVEIGAILAAHAALAARAVGQRASLEELSHHLEQALLSRDVIGQAKGILMERLKATPEDAFEILARASQHLNIKLREVARHLAESGDIPTPDA